MSEVSLDVIFMNLEGNRTGESNCVLGFEKYVESTSLFYVIQLFYLISGLNEQSLSNLYP